jgi:hypothetical protein
VCSVQRRATRRVIQIRSAKANLTKGEGKDLWSIWVFGLFLLLPELVDSWGRSAFVSP